MSKKKILITGKTSYIGTNFIKWLSQWPDKYETEAISVRNDEWKNHDFSKYDVVLHVAGIAHVSADPKMEQLYYKINRDLAIAVAKKAKREKVKQFIFMSSIIIYGSDGKIGEKKIITADTKPEPVDFYGKSKLEADLMIQKMENEQFKPVIIRTPVVYGPGCKGNFPKLIKLAKFTPIFFNIYNERSMIYIDNLCEFLRLVIDHNSSGVFFPQNKEYVSTANVISIVANYFNKKVYFTKIFNGLLKILSRKIKYINKVFGNKVYEKDLSNEFNGKYILVDFNKSIERTVHEQMYKQNTN